MTADDTRLAASFIQWDVVAKKQKGLPDDIATGDAARMDKDKITFTALGDAATRIFNNEEFSYHPEDSEGYLGPLKVFSKCNRDDQHVKVNRKTLIEILKRMDSDYVKLGVTDYYPLLILGDIGGEYAGAAIAPVFEEEDQ